MPHPQWFDLISAAADGELAAEEAEQLSEHLAQCAECASQLGDLEAERRRRRFKTAPAPAHLTGAILTARAQERAVEGDARSVLVRRATAAASVIVVLAIGTYFARSEGASTPVATVQPPDERIAVTDGAADHANVTVEPGATVEWRNPGTATHQLVRVLGGVTVDEELQPGRRERARFDRAGTFPYYCTIHPEIAGTVTVTG